MLNQRTGFASLQFEVYSLKLTRKFLPLKLLAVVLFLFSSATIRAQELKCTVEIIAQKLQTTDVRVFQTLETAIFEFMNTRKWTSDVFKLEEKIECSIFINVTEESSANIFRAQVSIQSSRPVFNSDYNSVVFNYADKDWIFEYKEFEQLEFSDNDFRSNLTAMLAYYAYLIIGLDYDTYSLNAGTPYYQKAQAVVNSIPSNLSSDIAPGWRPFENVNNRYWIIDNLLNTRLSPIRESMYLYHRSGMDVMYDNMNNGRQVVLNCLRQIGEVAAEYPNSPFIRLIFNAKSEELINIFAAAPPNEKANAVQLLYKCDPVNSGKYAKIMKP
ncbi:MAG: DUF4835 family protein [Chitinophagales bacterium]|nr:DUF4835 family protein [Chitinophagales bacterium]